MHRVRIILFPIIIRFRKFVLLHPVPDQNAGTDSHKVDVITQSQLRQRTEVCDEISITHSGK